MIAELKVGVIGCGGHAQSHFAMFRTLSSDESTDQ